MAVSNIHESNKSTASALFVNDFTSKNSVELQKKTEEGAVAVEQAKKAALDKIEQDRVQVLQTLKDEKQAAQDKNQEFQTKITQLQQEIISAKSSGELTKSDLTKQILALEDKTHYLDSAWHGKSVHIMNTESYTLVDVGQVLFTALLQVRTSSWSPENSNTWFTLYKTNTSDVRSPWNIIAKSRNVYLELQQGGDDAWITVGPQRNDEDGRRQQEWHIERQDVGKYVIRNAKWNTVIDLQNTERFTNNGPLRSYRKVDNDLGQLFNILPSNF